MEGRSLHAILLVGLLLVSGCLSGTETETETPDTDIEPNNTVSLTSSWGALPETSFLDGTPIVLQISVTSEGENWQAQPTILTPEFTALAAYDWTSTNQGFQLSFVPEIIGDYTVQISFELLNNAVFIEPKPEPLTHTISVSPVDEDAPILNAPVFIEIGDQRLIWFEGTVTHANIATCTLKINLDDNSMKSAVVKDDGTWKTLLDLSESESSFEILTVVECGEYTPKNDSVVSQILFENQGDDSDGDGIPDDEDRCPNGYGVADGWTSSPASDQDQDGCHDLQEDNDDDNDGVIDDFDLCPTSFGWVSFPNADYDSDGCHDADEDEDDDNDGILDIEDSCPRGFQGWGSSTFSDWDTDGCSDLDEDVDDDNDGLNDTLDSCPKGLTNWIRNQTTDFDDDGCADASEDLDDDNDSINDVNNTGATLDLCPETPIQLQVDENGCAAVQRDTDEDGVNDFDDQCPGTPAQLIVNSFGCADLDNDGVFANVDLCPNSPERWTIDMHGCAVLQSPVPWKTSTSLNAPMQTVPQFSVPALDGTFNFQQQWTGYDIYFFLFKYTDSSGSSNSGTWGQNPGTFLRAMPDNVHVFYGSFDTSYHADVINQKTAVENALSPSEEAEWDGRIHYIDQRANSISGGLGQMISSFNSPLYMGIDRFQLARETGSLYAWTSSNNDPKHLIHEPIQWNAEFPVEIRRSDAGIQEVSIMDFDRHTGGWGGGFTSTMSTVFPSNLTEYDTMEVYHEHACLERMNRYQKSDGTYGGCHEWDYEANLRICERDNTSACGTEFMRWITTYGREGKWLTDISPYLFMLENDDNRTFKYRGANKGDLTITVLLSNWGSGLRSTAGDFAFTGGQFDGTYNNLSKYTRDLNFTVPGWADKVEIVATITGHGFGKDNANCAEFCDHEHHYSMNGFTTYEWHPIVYSNEGCENQVENGVVANQFGSWPFGRAGWCAGQDVKQWTYDITSWSDMNGGVNHLTYRGLFNGQEYIPSDGVGNGQRNIHAEVWVVYYDSTTNS